MTAASEGTDGKRQSLIEQTLQQRFLATTIFFSMWFSLVCNENHDDVTLTTSV